MIDTNATLADMIDTNATLATVEVGGLRKPPGRKTPPAAGDAQYGRSSVTNGRRMYLDLEAGDAAWSRRFRDLYNIFVGDLNTETLTEGQRGMARRCATLALECEKFECQIAAGNAVDLALYGMLATPTLGQLSTCTV